MLSVRDLPRAPLLCLPPPSTMSASRGLENPGWGLKEAEIGLRRNGSIWPHLHVLCLGLTSTWRQSHEEHLRQADCRPQPAKIEACLEQTPYCPGTFLQGHFQPYP